MYNNKIGKEFILGNVFIINPLQFTRAPLLPRPGDPSSARAVRARTQPGPEEHLQSARALSHTTRADERGAHGKQ